MFGLGLGLGIHRHSSANPYAFPFISRVESDGGAIRDKAALLNLTYYLQSMMPNTKLLYCPELGIKLRTSGVNNYVTKLYDISSNMFDGTQTTALNQPFLSGNIAPNEKYAIKNPNGGSTYLTHTPISFSATDKWSVSTVVKSFGTKNTRDYYLAGPSASLYISLKYNTANYSLTMSISGVDIIFPLSNTSKFIGKSLAVTISYDNGNINLYVNGNYNSSVSKSIVSVFRQIFSEYSDFSMSGVVQYHSIRDIALSPTQVQDEYNYLRTLFPEIESVQIGTQTWATSNCEMIGTPQGNVIQEMQAAVNVEKITNAADREFSSDTGWNKMGGWSISGGTANCNASSWSVLSKNYASTPFVSGKLYRVSFTIISRISGSDLRVVLGNNAVVHVGTSVGEKIAYLKFAGPDINVLQIGSLDFVGSIDNISFQEVGWSDSTNLYNYIYANTSGTAEQKEYAAVKAAAMWCYYNNDPALGAVYGKLYNWYALKLLQMDIDYYNAANPTTPWGWRVPTKSDFDVLLAYLGGATIAGGKMKKDGSDYWYAPNSGADNSSGFSMLGAGRRGSVSGGFVDYKVLAILGTSDKLPSGAWGFFAQYDTMAINPSDYAVPTSDQNGFSLRLIRVSPVGD